MIDDRISLKKEKKLNFSKNSIKLIFVNQLTGREGYATFQDFLELDRFYKTVNIQIEKLKKQ